MKRPIIRLPTWTSKTSGLSIVIFTLFCAGSFAQPSDHLSFFVIGDWGDPDHEDQQRNVTTAMAKCALNEHVDFIVSTGDNFYRPKKDKKDPEHPPFEKYFEQVYTNSSIVHLPWYLTLGNHDNLFYSGGDFNYKKEIEYTSSVSNRNHRWMMPSNYYPMTFPIGGHASGLFLFVETNPLYEGPKSASADQQPGTQLAWLSNQLNDSTNRWKIVFGHHPIWQMKAGCVTDGDSRKFHDMGQFDKILRSKADAYFCGHTHELEHVFADGFHYFISGGGGSNLHANSNCPKTTGNFAFQTNGFAHVLLYQNKMDVTFRNTNGDIIASVRIQK